MNFFSGFISAEGLLRLFQLIAIVAGLLAVAALIGKDIASGIVADRKAKQLLVLQKDVADARTKQAEAETRLEELRRSQLGRAYTFDFGKFVEALKDRPKGIAIILYAKDDTEAYQFAGKLAFSLRDAGWRSPSPKPITPSDNPALAGMPSEMVAGLPGSPDPLTNIRVGIVANNLDESPSGSPDPLYKVLTNAFRASGRNASGGMLDSSLPNDTVRIVVGAKQ